MKLLGEFTLSARRTFLPQKWGIVPHKNSEFGLNETGVARDLLIVGPRGSTMDSVEVSIPNENGKETKGLLNVPYYTMGIVIFAHGSGSGRLSSRNQMVARNLNQNGLGSLLFDLLTEEESVDRKLVFDIPFLASRLVTATRWIKSKAYARNSPIGYFGASTGGGAALWAAADLKDEIKAVVSRGGRPDLAIPRLAEVKAPSLLIIGSLDTEVVKLNKEALKHLKSGTLAIVEGATHLFEEPGTLEEVSKLATSWFIQQFDTNGTKNDNQSQHHTKTV